MLLQKIFFYMFMSCVFSKPLLENEAKLPKNEPNKRPIIGILAQRVHTNFSQQVLKTDVYIAASYVKFIEMAGAQTVPILPSYSDSKIVDILTKINGVLFPGGGLPLKDSNYWRIFKLVFKHAIKFNDGGDYFPLFGTCLGFEAFVGIADKTENFTVIVDAKNYSVPLNVTEDGYQSRMFREMDGNLLKALISENVAMHNHKKGTLTSFYEKESNLRSMFKVLTTNKDRMGQEFISTIEGSSYPFYATIWHPEKAIFEWSKRYVTSHSKHAVRISQHISNFYVDEARKSKHYFPDYEEEKSSVMMRYPAIYTGNSSMFEQIYDIRINEVKLP